MNTSFKTHSEVLTLRPEIFWRWSVISFICIFMASIVFCFLFFRSTQAMLDAPIVVSKKNTEQQATRIEKRLGKVEAAVEGRTGAISPGPLVPTSQN